MTSDQILEALDKYDRQLADDSIEPTAATHALRSSKQPALQHVRHMVPRMRKFIEEGKVEKAGRWLGFLQGVLWTQGVYSIDDMRTDNRDPGDYTAPKTIAQWSKDINAWAKGKGWWGILGKIKEHLPGPLVQEVHSYIVTAKLALIDTEVAEAIEEVRAGRWDTWFEDVKGRKKPQGLPIELADAAIRIFDLCEVLGVDLEEAVRVKMAYNEKRPFMHGGKTL